MNVLESGPQEWNTTIGLHAPNEEQAHMYYIGMSMYGRSVTSERDAVSSPYEPLPYLQTQEYEPPGIGDRDMIRWMIIAGKQLPFLLNAPQMEKMRQARQQMEEIRQEAVPAHASNNEIDPIPDSAYEETLDLLEKMPHNVPLPDIMWNEDGGIGLEWRPENGIVTMSLYGDNHVIYGAFFGDKREVEGICTLSDTALLQGFLTTLRNFYPQKGSI